MEEVRMIDVGGKPPTRREAVAKGEIRMRPSTLAAIVEGRVPKGPVLHVAQVAGIMAAKATPRIVPLCHPLPLETVEVDIYPGEAAVEIEARVRTTASTGVEMEALTAVAAAALTVYDMCKGLDPEMTIDNVRLIMKSGGRSGTFRRPEAGSGGTPADPGRCGAQ